MSALLDHEAVDVLADEPELLAIADALVATRPRRARRLPYVAAAAVIPLGLLAVARLVRVATRAAGLRLVAALVLASALLCVAFSGHLVVRVENEAQLGPSPMMKPRPAEREDLPVEPAAAL